MNYLSPIGEPFWHCFFSPLLTGMGKCSIYNQLRCKMDASFSVVELSVALTAWLFAFSSSMPDSCDKTELCTWNLIRGLTGKSCFELAHYNSAKPASREMADWLTWDLSLVWNLCLSKTAGFVFVWLHPSTELQFFQLLRKCSSQGQLISIFPPHLCPRESSIHIYYNCMRQYMVPKTPVAEGMEPLNNWLYNCSCPAIFLEKAKKYARLLCRRRRWFESTGLIEEESLQMLYVQGGYMESLRKFLLETYQQDSLGFHTHFFIK